MKSDKSEDTLKERTSRKSKKKEKEREKVEQAGQSSVQSQIRRRLQVLPLEASIIGVFLLILLGAFYVVGGLSSL